MVLPAIDGFSELTEVGRGGFSVVFRARQDRFDRIVALKVLEAGDDAGAERRLARECRAMGRLSWHPNVAIVYDSGRNRDGRLWLAMEFHESGSLGDHLQSAGPMPWDDVAHAGVQVAGALEAAHRAGTVHRDVKPDNVLVGSFGDLKLSDFGIATLAGSTQTSRARSSFSLAYVPPEVLDGDEPDARSDVYGLAATLYALASGRPPFVTDATQSMARTLARTMTEPPPRLDEVPEQLAEIVLQGMAKDPAGRPPSAEAFGHALQDLQTSHAIATTDLVVGPGGLSRARTPVQRVAPRDETPGGVAPGIPSPVAGDPRTTIDPRGVAANVRDPAPTLPPAPVPVARPSTQLPLGTDRHDDHADAEAVTAESRSTPHVATSARWLAALAAVCLAAIVVVLVGPTIAGLGVIGFLSVVALWAGLGPPRLPDRYRIERVTEF